MKLHQHTAVSVAISGILFMIFKSWGMSVACFLSGIFIDLDHIIDYSREHGWSLDIRKFFRINHTCQYNRIVLIWHAWEWIILLVLGAWISDWPDWMTGLIVGLTSHLVLDTFSNGTNLWCYSILWRWRKRFEFDVIFPKMKHIKYKHR